MSFRVSEPLGEHGRASGQLGEAGGLALVLASVCITVFLLLALGFIILWLLGRLGLWLVRRSFRRITSVQQLTIPQQGE